MLLTALQSIDVGPSVPERAKSRAGAQIGLLYRAGNWKEAHEAAQNLETAEGSFWHAILHRHERDWSNASYWFRRVGPHPIYPQIHESVQTLLSKEQHPVWHLGSEWDPLRFVDFCEKADQSSPEIEHLVVAMQVAEWRHLFDWCIS